MNWAWFASLTGTAALAALGYFAKYLTDVRVEQRKSQLARTDRQLRELYGPLFGLVRTGSRAFSAFLESIRPGEPDFSHRPPTDTEAAEYRLWISHVFMPLNRRVAELILTRSDLLEESEMPEELLQATSNILEHEALLRHWQEYDYSRMQAVEAFPADELIAYAERWYVELKQRQRRLLGQLGLD